MVKKLQIAFVIPSFDPSRGGVERYAFALARGLAREGHGVSVFTRSRSAELPPQVEGVKIETVEVPKGGRLTRERRFDVASRERLGELGRWDIIQGFGRTTCHNVYRIGGGTHRAYLDALSDYWSPGKRLWEEIRPKNHMIYRVEHRIFSQPGVQYIANSERIKQEVIAQFQVPGERIQVVHNGVDIQQFQPGLRETLGPTVRKSFDLSPEDFVISFVGSGFARKGLAYALRIIAHLKGQGVRSRFIVAGKGRTQRYMKLARKLGIEDRVNLLGGVREVQSVYAASDAFLFPSVYEPFGNAPLEAMACGVPVVVTRCCGVAELLVEGREGHLLDHPSQAKQAARFLATLARNPALRVEFGERARATAERNSSRRNLEAVLDVYRSVLAHREPATGTR